MRLNPSKCTFGVPAGKFLGFRLTCRGIEANLDKCRAILEMQSPQNLKEVQRLVGRMTTLSRFIPKLAEHIRPILKNMKKGTTRHWDDKCEKAFGAVKNILTSPPIMARSVAGFDLQLYIAASHHASHQVIVRTNHPVAKILRKPELVGRMVSWSIKGQHLVDFAAELTAIPDSLEPIWLLNVDGSSNKRGGGTGIVLEGPNGLIIEQAITFRFQANNNQAEYEALIAGLILAKELTVARLECKMDSQLVVGHMNGTYQVKDNQLLRYFHKANTLLKDFVDVSIIHVPREQNGRVDLLSKLTHSREKIQLSSVIKMTLDHPVVETFATNVSTHEADWRQSIQDLMMKQERGEKITASDLKRIARFLHIGDDLYRHGHTTPLLKCISVDEADYVLRELHTGIYGFHSGKRTLRARVLRAGYYWPTIDQDCEKFVKKCLSCQAHGHYFRVPPEELHGIISPWPFA
ncbi:uncharacterized protein LOC124845134 [Vigna umbellata]|uniref:uncharacterized protein LOC124839122 n=1 Tax=Vigna umbellata TaxID=87088 RepID=UPI001F5ED1DE|nr:uncharacterized protein LOC124839122 [Vigna umbellata]XP_047178145.1 uncharacterized protein LOC124845134 [Vigna umbellata]